MAVKKTMKASDGAVKVVLTAGQDVSLSNTCQSLIYISQSGQAPQTSDETSLLSLRSTSHDQSKSIDL